MNKYAKELEQVSEVTREALRQAGWFPERWDEQKDYIEDLYKDGYGELTPTFLELLHCFGGLLIQRILDDGVRRLITFGYLGKPRIYISSADGILHMEDFFGKRLCCIGLYTGPNASILLDNEGKVYGLTGEGVLVLGDNLIQAIDNMLFNRYTSYKLPEENFYDDDGNYFPEGLDG